MRDMPPLPAMTTSDFPAYWVVEDRPCPRCGRNFGKAADLYKHSTGGLCMGVPDTSDTNTFSPLQTSISKGSWFKLLSHFKVKDAEGNGRELSPGMMGTVFEADGNGARVYIPGITDPGSLWLDVSFLEMVVLKGIGKTETTTQTASSQNQGVGTVLEAKL